MLDSEKTENNLPKPFAVPAPPSKKVVIKPPLKKNIIPPKENAISTNKKQQMTKPTHLKKPTVVFCEASQCSDESSVVSANRSKTLFKCKNNTLRTPDSNEKQIPMVSEINVR